MTEVALTGAVLPAERSPLPHDQNPYLVYLASLSKGDSRRAMAGCLDRIAALVIGTPWPPEPGLGETFPWASLRRQHTLAIRSALQDHTRTNNDGLTEPLAPAYINKHLAAMRKVLEHAWLLDDTFDAEDYYRAVKIEGVQGSRLPAGRSIAEAEVAAMLRVCINDDSPAGVRDAALIAFLQSTGGRRAEAASAKREEYDPGSRSLNIIGKRNKQREVDLHEQAAVYLGRWLSTLGRSSGPLFCPVDRWGNLRPKHLTPGAIAHIVNKRRLQAGLPPLGPHDFRRTFIGDLLDEGVDLATAQQIVGHESPTTTAKYDRRPRRTRKAAVERLSHRLPSPESLRDEEPLPHNDRSET